MPDDDWMNPKSCSTYQSKPLEDKTVYLIERAKKQICFDSPGYIIEWRVWSEHETEKARDEELGRLHESHPQWALRARSCNRYLESIGIFPNAVHPGINR